MCDENFKVLYSGNLNIDYGQFYVDIEDEKSEDYLEPGTAFIGQENGICGAAQKGKLFLVTGCQAGVIKIEVQLHQSKPTINDSYDEIVEVNIEVGKNQLMLCEWAHQSTHNLEISPQRYNVRYSITGMDKDYEEDDDWESPLSGQRYLLQFWQGDNQNDSILKCTSKSAKYWHKEWGNL